ncbi:DNA adenine methylase [Candidatus Saccharibacteria bacterium oral taxon 488]|nr:DNA adenine methylase [Candidatus Saccharibacteria bacterium oral taxon 488]
MSTGSLTATSIADTFDVNFIYARRLFQFVGEDSTLEDVQKLINAKPKPFVKWVGGKRQLLKQFRELGLYPPKVFNPIANTYHEPFVGGGAVFFDLLPKNAKLSDLNNELVITYNVIKDNVDELIKSLQKHIYDKEYYLEVRAKKVENLSDVEIASRFIFLNRTGFNGLYRVNKSGQFNVPFGRYNNPVICDEDNLRRVSDALRDVVITHQDYKNVLGTAKSGDFIYFDPPYYPINTTSSFTSYTVEGFLEKEQTELRDTLVKLHEKGCFVMLSNSDTPFINKLYSGLDGLTINKITAGRAINSKGTGRGKITEVLVTNY